MTELDSGDRAANDLAGQAEHLLRAGRAADAERLARRAASQSPDDDRAWRALGRALRDLGRPADAAEAWGRAARLSPDPDVVFELGKLLVELGRHVEAIPHLREAVKARADSYGGLTQLGIALGSGGRPTEAVEAFRAALRLAPGAPQAHHNLGVALLQAGRPEAGIPVLEEALRRQPEYPEAHYNLGNALTLVGRRGEALEHYRRALAQRPDYPEPYQNLGLHLTEAGRPEEAVPYLRQAVRLRPDAADAPNNLGIALEAAGRFDEAEAAYHAALARDPRYADAHANLGNCCKARGRLDEALACYQVALWLKPDAPSTRFNRSLALLQRGDWAEGWAEYEWRLRKGNAPPRRPSDRPYWDGSAAAGRTVVLWAEQGLGDAIQFARYVPLVKGLGFRVVLCTPTPLRRLLGTVAGVDELVVEGATLPAHDVQCPLMSLPHRFGTLPEAVPAACPYLAADAALAPTWRERLPGPPGLSVGLYWQGNPHHPWDRYRSLPLRLLAPLGRVPGVRLVSLQQGPGREQLGAAGSPQVVDLGAPYQTLDDLAAVASQLDLVVTVDTASAHLAGAIGKPTWVLLSALSDWRWLLDRPHTPWYPTVRLFRQRRLADWAGLVDSVTVELARMAGGNG